MNDKTIVATWSGGIDSTAVIAQLLRAGWEVTAVSLLFGPAPFVKREALARQALHETLGELGPIEYIETPAEWLWAFSPDGVEIPTRNRRIMDHLIAVYCLPNEIRNVGMGEYIGCDTWVVRDHVGAADCDARSLTAYLFEQYGLDWRLLTLADFGESRYKSDRLRLGIEVLGVDAMGQTTNCLEASSHHCGTCYKCVERAAAFWFLYQGDPTFYMVDPKKHPRFAAYVRQMHGEPARAGHSEFVS